jgi:hypothetical protein
MGSTDVDVDVDGGDGSDAFPCCCCFRKSEAEGVLDERRKPEEVADDERWK